MNHTHQNPKNNKKGFLLVEVIVALFLFSLVMTISIGSIISLLDANRKTQSQKSVMNNLDLTLDSMTRAIAVGKNYHCGDDEDPEDPRDCISGNNNEITFESNEDLNNNGNLDLITYSRNGSSGNRYIGRTTDSGSTIRMTAPEIDVAQLRFLVTGTDGIPNTKQPKVIILIDGTSKPAPRGTASPFHIQTIVSQRIPDIEALTDLNITDFNIKYR